MKTIEPRLFIPATCEMAEGPFWFEGRFWWVDIHAGLLSSTDAQGSDRQSFSMGTRLGAAAPVNHTHFLVAVEQGIGLFHRRTQTLEMITTLQETTPGARFNDGKCDPVGRFLAGTLNMDGHSEACSLYSLDEAGGGRKLLSSVSISNGLVWTADGATLYYIDSPTQEIAAFDYDIATGGITNRRTAIRIPRRMGIPDGMDIDVAGRLWVAHWDGWAVHCWNPETGECLMEIPIPCSQVTSCCFGGERLDQLFVTTAREGLSKQQLLEQPLAGSIFVCDPGTSGFAIKSASPNFVKLR